MKSQNQNQVSDQKKKIGKIIVGSYNHSLIL